MRDRACLCLWCLSDLHFNISAIIQFRCVSPVFIVFSARSSSLSSDRSCFMCSALSYRLCPAPLGLHHGCPYSKVHGASMMSTWVLSAPDGPHVGPISLAIRVHVSICRRQTYLRRLQCLSCTEFRIKALSYAAHVVFPRDIFFPVVIFVMDAWRKAICNLFFGLIRRWARYERYAYGAMERWK